MTWFKMNEIRRIYRSWGQMLDSRRGISGFNPGWIFFAIFLVDEVTFKDGWSSIFFSSYTNRYSAIVLATCSHPLRCVIFLTRQYVVKSSVFQQGALFLTQRLKSDKFFLSLCGLHVVFKDVISCRNCTGHVIQVFSLGNDVWHIRVRTEPLSKLKAPAK
jgi:hypothetical protein